MPYCNGCGDFYIYVDKRKLCQICAIKLKNQELDEQRIFVQRKLIKQHKDFKLLYYPAKFSTVQEASPNYSSVSTNNSQNTSIFQTVQNHQPPISQFAPPDQPETPFTMMFNRRIGMSRSKISLTSAVLGVIITFIPFLSFFGLFLEILALSIAIKALRTENQKWMSVLTIIISLGYLVLLIIGVVMILSDPELLAAMEAAINESTTG